MLKFTAKFIIDYLNIEINYCKNCYQMFFINNLNVIYTVSILCLSFYVKTFLTDQDNIEACFCFHNVNGMKTVKHSTL